MGIEPYLVSSSTIGIISQRLVKKLCNNCKKAYKASELEKNFLGISKKGLILYEPVGCVNCNNGFKGRRAVYEILPIDKEIKKMINKSIALDDIKNLAIKNGMTTLLHNLKRLALKGEITIDEVLRVGYTLK